MQPMKFNAQFIQIILDMGAVLDVNDGMWPMIKGEVLRMELENGVKAEILPEGFTERVNAKLIRIAK